MSSNYHSRSPGSRSSAKMIKGLEHLLWEQAERTGPVQPREEMTEETSMSISTCREVSEMGPGSAPWCPATGQEAVAKTDAQEAPPEYEEELLHCVWPSPAGDGPEREWSHPRTVCMQTCAPCSALTLLEQAGPDKPLWSFPTCPIPWLPGEQCCAFF